jgi:hypothetical protein
MHNDNKNDTVFCIEIQMTTKSGYLYKIGSVRYQLSRPKSSNVYCKFEIINQIFMNQNQNLDGNM